MHEVGGTETAWAVEPDPTVPAATPPVRGAGPPWRAMLVEMSSWSPRRWFVATVGAAIGAVLMGAPTDLLPNGLFQRMTPAVWWNYPVWILSSLLFGVLVATYVRDGATSTSASNAAPALGGGIVSVLAVGCPVCNKLVVLALGSSGAVSYFAPVQPVLGVLALGLLALGVRARLRVLAACPV